MKGKVKKDSKLALHKRNKHNSEYDFRVLAEINPKLEKYLIQKPDGATSINFKKTKAIIELNKTILQKDYQINNWEIPDNYLCPPIPGRADYIHYVADLLGELDKEKEIPKGSKITVFDVGTGASCIYPIIGSKEYEWNFVASEVDEVAFQSAEQMIASNEGLESNISLRKQDNHQHFFKGIYKEDESFDLSICNPPFNPSEKQPEGSTEDKSISSNPNKLATENLFEGGELAFIKKMILESKEVPYRFLWFTTLVNKKDNLKSLLYALKKEEVAQHKVIDIAQGNKVSRILAWSFLGKVAMRDWRNALWKEVD